VPCELTSLHLHAYLDGELDAAGSAAFEQHLRSCQECAQALRAERALQSALSGAQLYERAPDQLRAKLRSSLPADFPVRPKKSPIWQWAALAAALLLVAFVSRELFSVFRARSEGAVLATAAVDAHLRSLQPGHLTDVLSTDQHTVKPWFDGKLNFAPAVPNFPDDGFPLLGGRLDVLNGRTAAALVYGRRKHIINVFVLESQNPTAAPTTSGGQHGYHWLSWRQNGFTYLAVSDTATADLQQLRDLFLKE
jgi:anti-sigma factor (TIGR02949 family)